MSDSSDPQRILLIKPSSLGDIVHALPVLTALRARYPQAHIAWVVGTSFQSLLRGHPLIDEIIPFDRARFGTMLYNPAALLEFWRFVAAIRRRRFDCVIDLQGLLRSGLMSFFSGARRRIGFADAREWATLFYTDRVRIRDKAIHAVEKNVSLARRIGLTIDTPEFPLAITDAERAAARRMLEEVSPRIERRFTAVMPGARWHSKTWPAERFAELIDRLHADGGALCVLLGAPAEAAIAAEIRAKCAAPLVDLVGKTSLRELAALIETAERVICLDSGPMHIAAALGRPTLALFGPTDERRTGPYSREARVLSEQIHCRPCLRRICPLGHHGCMRRMEPARVAEAAGELRES